MSFHAWKKKCKEKAFSDEPVADYSGETPRGEETAEK